MSKNTPDINVVLDDGAYAPERAHMTDAGLDLKCMSDIDIPAGGSVVIDTGTHMQLPEGTAGLLVSKSGLNVKHSITSTGLIDEGYTGPVKVKLYNHSSEPYHISEGSKISQLIIIPVLYSKINIVDHLDETERGDAGFGSTGK